MSEQLTISSFCSGIGSFEQAMKNLQIPHKSVFAVEIDKFARETFLANHETETMYEDMTKYDYEGDEWYSDVNVSGIPCQAFSLAGKRLGELDPRGLLFYDFYKWVKNQSPKYFIIENVKGLLSDNAGATFQNWINLLGQSVNGDQFMFPHEDSLMYNLHWQVLNTKDYGLPQNRERVFLIGIRNDLPNSFVFPKGVPLKLRLKDILEESVDEKYYLSEKIIKYNLKHKEIHSERGNGFAFKPIKVEDKSIVGCLSTKYGSRQTDTYLKVPSATKSGYEISNDRIYSDEGLSPTLNTMQGGNRQPFIAQYTGIAVHPLSKKLEFDGFKDGNSPALLATDYKAPKCVQYSDYRIRKLTTLECFRLQGFSDEFHQKAVDSGVSASQRYKQAGNSISVPVIQAILKNLI